MGKGIHSHEIEDMSPYSWRVAVLSKLAFMLCIFLLHNNLPPVKPLCAFVKVNVIMRSREERSVSPVRDGVFADVRFKWRNLSLFVAFVVYAILKV